MNRLKSTITGIHENGLIHEITLDAQGLIIKAFTLSLPESIRLGSKTVIAFKETEVSLAPGPLPDMSLINAIPCHIQRIKEGTMFWEIGLFATCGFISAFVTPAWAKKHNLDINRVLTAVIRSTDITLLPAQE